MPSGEDNAGVDDLGVPVFEEAAGRRRSALHDGLAFQEPERGHNSPEHLHRTHPAHVHSIMPAVIHTAVIHAFVSTVVKMIHGGNW